MGILGIKFETASETFVKSTIARKIIGDALQGRRAVTNRKKKFVGKQRELNDVCLFEELQHDLKESSEINILCNSATTAQTSAQIN